MNNLYIIGGGTAGWLAALYAQKMLRNTNINLIESKNVGILGAGEGTTPAFIRDLQYLGISLDHVMRKAEANIKLGIDFINWQPGKSYFHSFHDPLDLNHNPLQLIPTPSPMLYLEALKQGVQIQDVPVQKQLAHDHKVPCILSINPPTVFNTLFALHFNAHKLALTFKEIGIQRGVNHIYDDLQDVEFEGNKVKVLKSDTKEYFPDFVIDCSGFQKLVMSKQPEAVWKKGADVVNTAIPFLLKYPSNKIYASMNTSSEVFEKLKAQKGDASRPPYTKAIAMKNGWIWEIPTLDRIGCGYVYDSKLSTEEEIKQEIRDHYPEAQILDKKFEFESGYYTNPWIGNCVSMGLSAGFIEPLEATSIMVSSFAIQTLFNCPDAIWNHDQVIVDRFNHYWCENNQEVHDFVYLHYLTGREDSPFWRKVNTPSNIPSSLISDLEKRENSIIFTDDFKEKIFVDSSWFMVMEGIGKLNTSKHISMLDSLLIDHQYLQHEYLEREKLKKEYVHKCEKNNVATALQVMNILY